MKVVEGQFLDNPGKCSIAEVGEWIGAAVIIVGAPGSLVKVAEMMSITKSGPLAEELETSSGPAEFHFRQLNLNNSAIERIARRNEIATKMNG